MSYTVKEIFYTLQGEGVHAGRAAVFLRFTGCNLWNGKEASRAKAQCQFCDTDFVGMNEDGGRFEYPMELAQRARNTWKGSGQPFIVCTGGEPLLQLDEALIRCLKQQGFEIAVESNGTVKAPPGIDWLCISPKTPISGIVQTSGDELKLVYPQVANSPGEFAGLSFRHFFISPKDGSFDGSNSTANLTHAVQYCLAHPQWRLSLQTHKLLNIR